MGGTQSDNRRIINDRIILRHEVLNIPDIDRVFDQAYLQARDTELIRCQFLPKWNDLMRKSGAIVLSHPNFANAVEGILWKFAIDFKGNAFNCEINEDEPFLVFKDSSIVRAEDMEISNSFIEVCRFWQHNQFRVEALEKDLQRSGNEIDYIGKEPETLFGERGVAPIEIYTHMKKLALNTNRIKNAYMCIEGIRIIFTDISRGLESYSKITRDPEEMKKIEVIAKQALAKVLIRPPKIVYRFSHSQKLTTYEDHFDIIEEDLKAEKIANKILENSGLIPKEEEHQMPITTASTEERKQVITQENLPYEKEKNFIKVDTTPILEKKTSEQQETNDNKCIKVISNDNMLNIPNLPLTKTQIMTDNEKNELIIEETFPLQESRPLALSTIIDESKNIEIQSLQKEIEELKNENVKLNEKVSLIEEKTQNPVKVSVFIKHHVPLKGWNFIQKKVVQSSTSNKITVIESAPDLDYIITGNVEGDITFWKFPNFASVSESKVLRAHNSTVKAILYLTDGKTLFSAGLDGLLLKFDLTDLSLVIIEDKTRGAIRALANPYTGSTVIAACENNIVSYDFQKIKTLSVIEAHENSILDLSYQYQREILISASKDKKIKIWGLHSKECLGILQGNIDIVNSVCFAYTPKHFYIVSTSKDAFITFWNMTDKNLTKSCKMNSNAKKVLYFWDKKTVCTIHKDGTFSLWNIEERNNKEYSAEREVGYTGGCYYDDGHNMIISTSHGTVDFWNCH